VTAERGVGRREQFFIKRMDLIIEEKLFAQKISI
jgi:hypothetical protein